MAYPSHWEHTSIWRRQSRASPSSRKQDITIKTPTLPLPPLVPYSLFLPFHLPSLPLVVLRPLTGARSSWRRRHTAELSLLYIDCADGDQLSVWLKTLWTMESATLNMKPLAHDLELLARFWCQMSDVTHCINYEWQNSNFDYHTWIIHNQSTLEPVRPWPNSCKCANSPILTSFSFNLVKTFTSHYEEYTLTWYTNTTGLTSAMRRRV